jgi:hypothetical protein
MKSHLIFAGLALTGIVMAAAHRQAPEFSDSDRQRAISFWQNGERYVVAPSPKQQVRLTVAGSQWLFKYAHSKGGGKINPNIDAKPAGSPKAWEDWINAKVSFDRAQAQSVVDADPNSDPTDNSKPYNDPGPCPADLEALVGTPPTFAEACAPNTYTVRFDDATVVYLDHVKVRPRYVYYRSAEGVDDGGKSMKTFSSDRIDHLFRMAGVDTKAANVMRCVSSLEGGFDSVNTYDTGFVSVGFIQFASQKAGSGSLGEMMLKYKHANPTSFDRDFRQFGVDVTPEGKLAVLDLSDGRELIGPDANAKIISDKRLTAVFGRAGAASEEFMAAQIASAKEQFYPDNDTFSLTIGGQKQIVRVSDVITSEAGMATLMDRKVNTGHIDPLASVAQRVADAHSVSNVAGLNQYEAEIISQLRYRKDYLADASLSQPGGTSGLTDRHSARRNRR